MRLQAVLLLIVMSGCLGQNATLTLTGSGDHFEQGGNFTFTCAHTGTAPSNILYFYREDVDSQVNAPCTVSLPKPCSADSLCGCVSHSGNTSTHRFVLTNVNTSSAGTWICRIPGLPGFDPTISSQSLCLPVYGKPSLPSLLPASAVAVTGSDVNLTCSSNATTLPASERLPLSYSWFRGGNPVSGGTGGSLVISPVSPGDEGNYTCRSREGSDRLTSELSIPYFLDVQYGPASATLLPPGASYEVRETTGAVPSITCQADCDPPCSFRWTDKTGSEVGSSARFPLRTISRQQAGSFRCTASNAHGSQTVQLSIQATYPPDVRVQMSNCAASTTYVTEVGTSVTLTCDVTAAYPSVTGYQWSVKGSGFVSGESQRQLTVTRSSGGQYACLASNGVQSPSSHSVLLDVQYPPEVTLTQTSLTVVEGANVSVLCQVEARPNVTSLVWRRDSGSLPPGVSTSSPRLQLPHVTRDLSGLYTCTATNLLSPCDVTTAGQRTGWANFTLDVQYAPTVTSLTVNSASSSVTVDENEEWTLRCNVTSNPSSTIRLWNGTSGTVLKSQDGVLTSQLNWTAQCLHAGNYTCDATNTVSTAQPSSPVQLLVTCSPRLDLRVLGTRTTLASSLGGNVTFTLPLVAFPSPQHLWYRQDNNGSGDGEPILGAGASSSGGTASLTLTSVQQRDFGLYFLNVSNQAGAAVFTFELIPQGPPECPANTTVHSVDTKSLTVSWERGFNSGGVQHFLVEVREGAGQWRNSSPQVGESALQDRYSLTLDTSSLQPGTDLALRVRAYNQFGSSQCHGFVRATIAQENLPRALIGGVVGSLSFVIFAVIIAVVLIKKRRAREKPGCADGHRNFAGTDSSDLTTSEQRASPGTSNEILEDNILYESSNGLQTSASVPVHPILEDNPLYESSTTCAPPKENDKQKKSNASKVHGESNVYAQVAKKKTAAKSEKKKGKHSRKGDAYENVELATSSPAENVYANSGDTASSSDKATLVTEQVPEPVGPTREVHDDGCVYVTVQSTGVAPRKPPKPIKPATAPKPSNVDAYKDDAVIYTDIDHTKKAPVLDMDPESNE